MIELWVASRFKKGLWPLLIGILQPGAEIKLPPVILKLYNCVRLPHRVAKSTEVALVQLNRMRMQTFY